MQQSKKGLQGLVHFFHVAGKLKNEPRRGWVDRGVKQPESVADHSFRLALMAAVLGKKAGFDSCKLAKMALFHDLPEAFCGDVATRFKEEWQEISNKEKRQREETALKKMLSSVDKETAEEIWQLWKEFDERKTAEAKFLYELDKLEAISQAVEYEKEGNFEASLQEFFDFGESELKNAHVRELFLQLERERKKG